MLNMTSDMAKQYCYLVYTAKRKLYVYGSTSDVKRLIHLLNSTSWLLYSMEFLNIGLDALKTKVKVYDAGKIVSKMSNQA